VVASHVSLPCKPLHNWSSSVCYSLYRLNYDAFTIDSHASCEIHPAIHFLQVKNVSAMKIHNELCEIYGWSIMCGGTVRLCCRMFKDGRKNVNDEERNGRSSVVIDDFVRSVDQ
jgi:hypothetical protein